MAEAGEYHGQVLLVGGGDHFRIAHRAAGLDHRRGAGLGQHVEAVAEGEEGVRCRHRADHGEAVVLGLDRGDARRIDAAHLAGADADGHAVLAIDDGVRLDVLGDAPGEQQVGHFLRGRRAFGHHLDVGLADARLVGALQQQAAADALVVEQPATLPSGTTSTRRFCLAANTARASAVISGAMMTSANWPATASAVALSMAR
jgi:hypothetical protein